MLDRSAIARLIPHQGAMCLLDGVSEWSANAINCWALSHRAPENPLRRGAALGALAGIEYGLQAMAVHGALRQGKAQPPGYLSSLRDVEIGARELDDIAGRLAVTAELLVGTAQGFIYRFAVRGDGALVVAGRAAIAFAADAGLHA